MKNDYRELLQCKLACTSEIASCAVCFLPFIPQLPGASFPHSAPTGPTLGWPRTDERVDGLFPWQRQQKLTTPLNTGL